MKEFGLFAFLNTLAEQSGLIKCLIRSLGKLWQKVFILAVYLVSEGDPA
jgi:hypothetical protein